MVRTQIYIPEELHRELTFLAKKESLSLAELIRQFVRMGIKTKKRRRNSGKTLLELARYAVKGLPKDLSTKHDEYLYGKKSPFGK